MYVSSGCTGLCTGFHGTTISHVYVTKISFSCALFEPTIWATFLESDGGLRIAPTLLVVVGLSERSLTIGFLVAPTSGGGGQLVWSGSHIRGAAIDDGYFGVSRRSRQSLTHQFGKRRGMSGDGSVTDELPWGRLNERANFLGVPRTS